MGRIAAILSRKGDDVSTLLLRMLKIAPIIPSDSIGISTSKGTVHTKTLKAQDILETPSALACSNRKIQSDDTNQPLDQYGYSFVVEGRLWGGDGRPYIQRFADKLGKKPEVGLRSLIKKVNGSFAIAILGEKEIMIGRDSMGVVPLYHGADSEFVAVATNKKMLWSIGLEARALSPGHIARLSRDGISIEPVLKLSQPTMKDISMEEAVDELERLFERAVEARCRDLLRVSLGFSGGIDSGLVAHYLDYFGMNVKSICVGLEDSSGFQAAEESAGLLDIPLRIESFNLNDVEQDLDAVLWSVEDPDPMKVSVALTLYWTAGIAAKEGCRVLFSGNGSDELFAGYHRHASKYQKQREAVAEMIYHDVGAAPRVNYERDYKTAMDQGLELRLPYADREIVDWGLSIPPYLKLSKEPEGLRKIILRRLAEKLELPREIVERPKKAVQYSTGVDSNLRQLAKRRGKSLRQFLKDRLKRLKKERLEV